MCHFVFTALPPKANLDAIRPIAKSFSRPLSESGAKIGGGGVSRPMVLFYTTKHCDCGTAIGAGVDRARIWSPSDTELRKRRRRGWSEAKIARWVEEHRKAEARRAVKDAEFEQRSLPEAENWLAFVTAALKSGATPRIGILLAWSPSQSIEIQEEVRTPIAEATPSLLYEAQELVLYTFVPGRAAA